jgi:hypothetical protein
MYKSEENLQCSNNPEVSELGVGAITVLPLADVDL